MPRRNRYRGLSDRAGVLAPPALRRLGATGEPVTRRGRVALYDLPVVHSPRSTRDDAEHADLFTSYSRRWFGER